MSFHQSIGDERKAARLRYLRDRWARPIRRAGRRVTAWTPPDDDRAACGIAMVGIEGIEPAKLSDHLFARHKIVTVAIRHKDFSGIRVTPNVYTTPGRSMPSPRPCAGSSPRGFPKKGSGLAPVVQ